MPVNFTIPRLYCPWPKPPDHPDLDLLESRGLDWMASRGITPDPVSRQLATDTQSHLLMSLLTPHAPAERVQLIVDWCYLLFSIDDLRTDIGPTSADTALLMTWLYDLRYAQTIPDGPPQSTDPMHLAMANVSERIRTATSPALWRRWVESHHPTYWGALWESALRARSLAPSFNSYLPVRAGRGAAVAALATAELVNELRVPEHEREHPLVKTVVDAAFLVMCLHDDLYSHPKEAWKTERSGRDPALGPRGIPILMREHHIDEAEAATLLAGICDRLVLLLTRLLPPIKTGPFSPDTIALVDLAVSMLPTGLAWGPDCPRYTNPDGRSPGAIEMRWQGIHNTPPTHHGPLPYPSIASWWKA
ncbi:terpene synthase family protein [Streptomyces olivoreticuli]|uniref:terpene synthase family protein n=1 Tax=Streptomyces olivoreticuli TaxID=68246 RepID=UPI002658833B|nr:terpene synthase family protein [Streptomyces olivoreticuli]WKK24177.1 terpene synthase family protein [Streptomyces olivoreticuli]